MGGRGGDVSLMKCSIDLVLLRCSTRQGNVVFHSICVVNFPVVEFSVGCTRFSFRQPIAHSSVHIIVLRSCGSA